MTEINIRIDRLKRLEAEATPAPWQFIDGSGDNEANEPSYTVVRHDWDPDVDYDKIMDDTKYYNSAPEKADAIFLTELRNAWPEIIRRLDRMEWLDRELSEATLSLVIKQKKIHLLFAAARIARKEIDDFYLRGGTDDNLWYGRDIIDQTIAELEVPK